MPAHRRSLASDVSPIAVLEEYQAIPVGINQDDQAAATAGLESPVVDADAVEPGDGFLDICEPHHHRRVPCAVGLPEELDPVGGGKVPFHEPVHRTRGRRLAQHPCVPILRGFQIGHSSLGEY